MAFKRTLDKLTPGSSALRVACRALCGLCPCARSCTQPFAPPADVLSPARRLSFQVVVIGCSPTLQALCLPCSFDARRSFQACSCAHKLCADPTPAGFFAQARHCKRQESLRAGLLEAVQVGSEPPQKSWALLERWLKEERSAGHVPCASSPRCLCCCAPHWQHRPGITSG